jgi:hypothetical protein
MRQRLTSNIKLILLILASLSACARANAQTTCSLKPNQLQAAPEFFGFHLGMTFEQAQALSALIRFGRPDVTGVVKTTINPHYDRGVETTSFVGVRTISLDFLDGRLVTLWIGYEETFKWPKLDEFVAGLSKSLSVPAAWPAKRNGRELTCDGFSLFASIIADGPSIRITDDAAANAIAERREAAVAAAEAQVIGDLSTKSYYPSDCPAKDDVPPISRVIYKNKDEAETAGFKMAKECQ